MLEDDQNYSEDDELINEIRRMLQPVRDICNSYAEAGARSKHDVQIRLFQYAYRLLNPQHSSEASSSRDRLQTLLRQQIQGLAKSDQAPMDVVNFNVACLCVTLAIWLREKKCAPNTLAVYCSRLSAIATACISCPLHEIDLDWAEELMPFTYSDGTRNIIRIVWKKLARTFREDLGVDVPLIDWRALRLNWRLREMPLIGQRNVEKLLDYLAVQQEAAAYHAVLLAYFWGLRISEVVKLTLGDVVLNSSQPYLYIQRSKRGRSRLVYTHHVPDSVLHSLLDHWRQQGQSTRNQSARFVVDQNGQPLDADTLSAAIINALARLGIRTNAHNIVFHTLRHDYANRLFVLGVDVREIAKSMGHRSPDTTIRNYFHCFAWEHKRILMEADAEQYVSQSIAALYLDVDRRHVKNLLSEIEIPNATIKHSALFDKPMRGKESRYVSHSALVELIRKRMMAGCCSSKPHNSLHAHARSGQTLIRDSGQA
jgi:integrase